jgi:hypothetical protein
MPWQVGPQPRASHTSGIRRLKRARTSRLWIDPAVPCRCIDTDRLGNGRPAPYASGHLFAGLLRGARTQGSLGGKTRGSRWLVRTKESGDIPGLGPGESSTILAATKLDVLILDDRAARLDAKARGLRVTGLLGLLVRGARSRRIEAREAVATLEALAKGPFRMTAELYAWARTELENTGTRK